MMNFVSLHNHSVYSFHAGVATIAQLVKQAKALGMTALALTDTNRMSGVITFYFCCKEHGIKPILGIELTESHQPTNYLVMLAKNAEGYGDVCEILTRRNLDTYNFSFKKTFAKHWPNLVLFTAHPDLLRLLAESPNKPNLYGEIINNSAESRIQSNSLEQTARELDVPLMASNNVYFLNTDDFDTHKTLVAIGKTATLSRLKPHEYAPIQAYLKPHDAMVKLFPDHQHALATTARIANACNVELSTGKWIMPAITVPNGTSPDACLRTYAMDGLHRNYGSSKNFAHAQKIQQMELDVIERLGYASYFLIVKEIRDWASKKFCRGYRKPTDSTILRGSAANSITFYDIGVSDLDPIRYDLYFQRFLNEDRASPPDADLDFGWDEREEALDYMVKRWGRDRVAITGTTNHFRRRAAFRETAKVYGYSEEQITAILKSHKTRTRRIEDDEIRHLLTCAERIRGKPRFMGQHPGGVLVTNQPIYRHVACEYSRANEGRIITQIDMHSGIDELGLIKFDLLGNGSLSVLRDTLLQLHEQGLPDPGIDDVDMCSHDPRVRELIRTGKTRGIFYIESPAQMRLNQKSQAETFEEIAITSSLVRPAGAKYTKVFVERHREHKRGVKTWDFVHPSLGPILGETHDVCAYQEDVTKICHLVAGLTYKQADTVRKMMNSLHEGIVGSDDYQKTAHNFINGCIQHSGLLQEQAIELWERVSSFTGFSFCKSHSASYARLSFKCTWLKAYYPAQFLAAVISNNHGFYSRDVYVNEARRFGIRILPANINDSHIAYYGKHNWLRIGFMHIRQMGDRSLKTIIDERTAGGPFKNLVSFTARVPIHKKQIESLILVGAFDGFGLTRPESLFLLDDIYKTLQPDTPDLFGTLSSGVYRPFHPGLDDYTLAECCLHELHLLGFMVSGNILDILDLHPAATNTVPAADIGSYSGKRIKMFVWPMTNRMHLIRAERAMMFMTVADKSECCDVILWPEIYERYADVVAGPGPYEIWGTVREDFGTYALEAERISAVAWSPAIIDFSRASERLKNSFPQQDFTYADHVERSIAA